MKSDEPDRSNEGCIIQKIIFSIGIYHEVSSGYSESLEFHGSTIILHREDQNDGSVLERLDKLYHE